MLFRGVQRNVEGTLTAAAETLAGVSEGSLSLDPTPTQKQQGAPTEPSGCPPAPER